MTEEAFDSAGYTRLPNFSVRSAVTIASALLALGAPVTTAAVRTATQRLRARADEAKKLLARRVPRSPKGAQDASELDLAADRAWSALHRRLEGYAMLSDGDNPRIAKSRELIRVLFGDEGLRFVNAPYAEQAAATAAILDRIDAESLTRDLEQCAGKDFIELVRAIQPDYEAMVREFLARDEQNESLRPVQLGLQRALVQYATAVVGAIDLDDEAQITAVVKALAPLANAKAAVLEAAVNGAKKTPDVPADGK